MTACGSLSDAVDDSMNVTFDWEEEWECVLLYLLAASEVVTTCFGVEISKVLDVNMSDNLSSWLSNVHSMLHPACDGRASNNNPSSNRNDAANSGPDSPTDHDGSIMTQILWSQQQITDYLVQLSEISVSVQRQLTEAITKKDSVRKSKH